MRSSSSGVDSSNSVTRLVLSRAASTQARSASAFSGRPGPLASARADASLLRPTTRLPPSARASARYVTWPRCRMSKTPFVKTMGRASAGTRAVSTARAQSLSRNAAAMHDCRLRDRRIGAAPYTARAWQETTHADALRNEPLELLQQGQDGAAREGRALRGRDGEDRSRGRGGPACLTPRQD